jgi:hypothetical protein
MNALRQLAKRLSDWIQAPLQARDLLVDDYRQTHLFNNPRYADFLRLNRHETQIYSQNGEDGITAEILRRVGVASQRFVEIGVGNGLENNTAYWLTQGWSGVWFESNPAHIRDIRLHAKHFIQTDQLTIRQARVTSENVASLLNSVSISGEIDLLSIDIDGNDYWVWKSAIDIQPRLVIIEYNARYPPESQWVMPYDPAHEYKRDVCFGASLGALVQLATEKNYSLVGCDFTGVNAFFVRQDLAERKFCEPFTAHNHYEPPRYFLRRSIVGRRRLA